jgi:hypothetical protein
LSEKQLVVLEELSRSRTMARGIVQRASIILLGFQGFLNEQITAEVGLNRPFRNCIRDTKLRLSTVVAR